MKLKFTTNVLPVFISKEPAIPAQGPPPRDDFYGSSCPLGHSWICTPDKQNPLACPLGLTAVCPGVNQPTQASAGPSHFLSPCLSPYRLQYIFMGFKASYWYYFVLCSREPIKTASCLSNNRHEIF